MRNTELLDGVWEFAFVEGGKPEFLPRLQYRTFLPVPGCFDALPEYYGRRGTGHYRRKVRGGGRSKLEIGALGLRARLFWDGREIGGTDMPYTPLAVIFDAGEEGEHELYIAADNRLETGEVELYQPFYDFYGYGGVYRSCRLTRLPPWSIDELAVTPLDIATGEVRVEIRFEGAVPAKFLLTLAFDGGEETAFEATGETFETTLNVPAFRLWSPETPNLHTLTAAAETDSRTTEFGIRTLDWSGEALKLNGRPLKLIGYNRHESHPEFGAATPDALIASDLLAIKNQGCNFIRGSHYKQCEAMLSLCDRLGLLVWEESLGWGNNPDQLNSERFCKLQVEQTARMVRASRNHPSIILWGFLNEACTMLPESRPLVENLRKTIRGIDRSRPVTFASNRIAKDICLDLVDVLCFNTYPGWYDHFDEPRALTAIGERYGELKRLADRPDIAGKPIIVSEIGAAAIPGDYSGVRWSEDYQADLDVEAVRLVLEDPRFTGIALWQFCNIPTYITTSGFLTRPRGFNNKGVVDEYRRPKLAWRELTRLLKGRGK